jgi:YHS domain-containing protein
MVNVIRLMVLFGVIYFLYRLFKAFFLTSEPKVENTLDREKIGKGEDLIEDPYCRRYLPMSQAFMTSIDGKTVYFCSRGCCEQYLSEKDLKKEREAI